MLCKMSYFDTRTNKTAILILRTKINCMCDVREVCINSKHLSSMGSMNNLQFFLSSSLYFFFLFQSTSLSFLVYVFVCVHMHIRTLFLFLKLIEQYFSIQDKTRATFITSDVLTIFALRFRRDFMSNI